MPAQGPFGHEGRDSDKKNNEHVKKNECDASEFPDHVRKPPDGAKPNGHTDHGHQKAKIREKSFSLQIHSL
jgi:hypothetical protein